MGCLCSSVVLMCVFGWVALCLLNVDTLELVRIGGDRLQIFHGHQHEDKLKCPYKGCEKIFDKPTVITDNSVIPRETHYACPYCMSKLTLITERNKVIEIKPTEYGTVFDSPAKCAHYSGQLSPPEGNLLAQDECLICPKVLQCNKRKR